MTCHSPLFRINKAVWLLIWTPCLIGSVIWTPCVCCGFPSAGFLLWAGDEIWSSSSCQSSPEQQTASLFFDSPLIEDQTCAVTHGGGYIWLLTLSVCVTVKSALHSLCVCFSFGGVFYIEVMPIDIRRSCIICCVTVARCDSAWCEGILLLPPFFPTQEKQFSWQSLQIRWL